MKFFLDTDIWSYVADTESLPDLLREHLEELVITVDGVNPPSN